MILVFIIPGSYVDIFLWIDIVNKVTKAHMHLINLYRDLVIVF